MDLLEMDTDILWRFRNGDNKAMAYLFKLYHHSLYYFARQLVNDDQQAEDIVAEAFIQLSRKREGFETLKHIKAFLYLATRNSCYNYLKHIHRKIASQRELLHLAKKNDDFVESRIIKTELLQSIMMEVETLPPIRRKIFKMIFIEDLSVFEIATRLNITIDTVRVQKARALQAIRSAVLRNGMMMLIFLPAILSFCHFFLRTVNEISLLLFL